MPTLIVENSGSTAGTSHVSASIATASGDLYIVCGLGGYASAGAHTNNVTIANSGSALTWTETTSQRDDDYGVTGSIFTATSDGESRTITISMSGAVMCQSRIYSIAAGDWTAIANTDTVTPYTFGATAINMTLSPAPATSSLVVVCGATEHASWAHPSLNSPGSGWTEDYENVAATAEPRYYTLYVQIRTASTSTTAGYTSGANKEFSCICGIEVTVGAGAATRLPPEVIISQAVQRAAVY